MTFQKHPNAISKQVRDSARGEECLLKFPGCRDDRETTVFCHIRMFGNAGVSQKPPDYHGVYGCTHCHDLLDRRGSKAVYDPWDLLRALMQTHQKLSAKGLLVLRGQK